MKSIAEEIHKPVRKVKERRRVRVNEKDEIWAMDLVDMNEWKDSNNGEKYMLTVVDVFTRYAWARPMSSKNATDTFAAFISIVDSSGRKPKKLWVDQGKEFYNATFKQWMKANGAVMYSTFGESKSVIVERFNRTLKTRMWRYFTEANTRRWVDVLPRLISEYNSQKHSTLKMSPESAGLMAHQKKIYLIHNPPLERENGAYMGGEKRVPKWKIGDVVRVSRIKGIFEKGYLPGWSREIFTIVETQVPFDVSEPVTYKLQDRNGEVLQGSFYDAELGPVKYPDVFLVEKVLKTKMVKGKKQLLAKFLGYPDSFNRWLPESDVLDDLV